jgi:RNA polymerase sigma factor (sigma-70 family)
MSTDFNPENSDLPPSPVADAAAAPPEGHAARVAELFREHNCTLVSFLKARLQSEQDAREVAQEAYVRLLQIDRPGAVSFLRSYLFRTAENLAIDRLRQRQVRRGTEPIELFESLTDEREAPEAQAAAVQELSFIRQCLFELPERWRDAFIRHRVLGESEVSIARSYGLSDRMVRNYLVQTLYYCRARMDGRTIEQAKERLGK